MIKERNKKVIHTLYQEGYNIREISLLTNQSILKVFKLLMNKKTI